MNIIESIKQRRSIRTYTGEPLNAAHKAQIQEFINQLKAPFGVKARIEMLSIQPDKEPVKLGTYGWIKGAVDYLALVFEEALFAETAAAYMFEQVVLFCTSLGLGTCWLGGSFSRKDFKKQLSLKPNESLRIVSPVGYPNDKKRLFEKIVVNAEHNHSTRKHFSTLFFHNQFDKPLTQTTAGVYYLPLEMVRLAPSANNKQEWRAVLQDEQTIHFYKKTYINFDSIDIGIALCHFELTCRELGIEGKYVHLEDFPKTDLFQYVISWKGQDSPAETLHPLQ